MKILVTIVELEEMLNMLRATIYRKLNNSNPVYYDPLFPLPVKLAERRVAWVYEEIVEWIKTLPRASYDEETKTIHMEKLKGQS